MAVEPHRYEIVLQGRLGARLEHCIDGFQVTSTTSEKTYLVGWVNDQAALQGALRRVSDFGLGLVSVRQLPDTS